MRTLGYEMFGGKFSTTISWKSKFMKSNQMKKHDSNSLGQDHVNCLKK